MDGFSLAESSWGCWSFLVLVYGVFRVSSQLKSRFETDGLLSYETVDALQQARDTQRLPTASVPTSAVCALRPDATTD